jgi:ABC-type sugar transport system ATPase subunit
MSAFEVKKGSIYGLVGKKRAPVRRPIMRIMTGLQYPTSGNGLNMVFDRKENRLNRRSRRDSFNLYEQDSQRESQVPVSSISGSVTIHQFDDTLKICRS